MSLFPRLGAFWLRNQNGVCSFLSSCSLFLVLFSRWPPPFALVFLGNHPSDVSEKGHIVINRHNLMIPAGGREQGAFEMLSLDQNSMSTKPGWSSSHLAQRPYFWMQLSLCRGLTVESPDIATKAVRLSWSPTQIASTKWAAMAVSRRSEPGLLLNPKHGGIIITGIRDGKTRGGWGGCRGWGHSLGMAVEPINLLNLPPSLNPAPRPFRHLLVGALCHRGGAMGRTECCSH